MATPKADRAAVANRRAQAVALRLAGADLDSIGEALKYACATPESRRAAVSKDISRALDASLKVQARNAEALRELELMRLDRMQAGLWSAAKAGDTRAVAAVLAISDRRCRLLGLDEAIKVDATVTETTQADLEVQELIREAQAKTVAGGPASRPPRGTQRVGHRGRG